MIKLILISSSIFLHFTMANAILNSSQNDERCDLQNLVKLVKVLAGCFTYFENIFDPNSQYDNDSVPALLSTSGDSMISSQYLRVTLKSFLPISKFIIKAVSFRDDDLKGIYIYILPIHIM